MAMTITLNGQAHPLQAEMSIRSLLESLDLAGKPVVVELNEAPVFPADHDRLQVTDGDRVEIVVLAAGG